MRIRLLSVPYDTGVRDARMGRGPQRLLDAGLADTLAAAGHRVEVGEVTVAETPLVPEPRRALELWRRLAEEVRAARADGALPVVLSGVCYAAVGTVAAIGPEDTAVLWFDTHGDFNTPETTVTGFLDGMAIAVLAGRCWRQLTAQVPGFVPVPEDHVRLIGARDLDLLESELLETSAVGIVDGAAVRSRFPAALQPLAGLGGAYLHIDLDVLDPSVGRVNHLSRPGGLQLEELLAAVDAVTAVFPLRAVALTAYDPAVDPGGAVCRAAAAILVRAVGGG